MYQRSAGKEARALKNASLGWEAGNLTLGLFVPYGCGKVDTPLHSETSLNETGMIPFIGASEASGELQEVCSTVPGLKVDQLPAHNPRGLLIVVWHLYQAWCSLLNEARFFSLGPSSQAPQRVSVSFPPNSLPGEQMAWPEYTGAQDGALSAQRATSLGVSGFQLCAQHSDAQ